MLQMHIKRFQTGDWSHWSGQPSGGGGGGGGGGGTVIMYVIEG